MKKLIIPNYGSSATVYDTETDGVSMLECGRVMIDELWIVPHDCTVVFEGVAVDVEKGSVVIRTYPSYSDSKREIVVLDKNESAASYFIRVNEEYQKKREAEMKVRSEYTGSPEKWTDSCDGSSIRVISTEQPN